jgi:hypothetical protein
MAPETAAPVKLDSTFLTGPGGFVYELPCAEAQKYIITPERVKELGHLPVTPYGTQAGSMHSHVLAATTGAGEEASDVEGRHLARNAFGRWVWHDWPVHGTFRGPDGVFYRGVHFHPYGTEIGVFA